MYFQQVIEKNHTFNDCLTLLLNDKTTSCKKFVSRDYNSGPYDILTFKCQNNFPMNTLILESFLINYNE